MAEPKRVTNNRLDSGQAANDSQYNSPEARRQEFTVVGGNSPQSPANKKVEESEADKTLPRVNERIKSSDRSHLNQPFFEKSSTNRVGRVTVDERFAGEYDKRGLRPSYESVDPRIKNVRVREKYAEEAANDGFYPETEPATKPQTGSRKVNKLIEAQKRQKERKATFRARARVRKITAAVRAPLWFTYLFVQLPFALLSIVLFPLADISEEIKDATTFEEDSVFGYVLNGFRSVSTFIGSAVSDVVRNLTNGAIDLGQILAAIDPTNWMFLCLLVVLFYGIISLMILGLVYSAVGIRSFSGEMGSLKVFVVALCFIGYFWPVFNLIPWIIFWMMLVAWKPK